MWPNRKNVIVFGFAYVTLAALINGEIASHGGSFTEQLIITLVSGVLSAGGVILGSWFSAREGRRASRIARANQDILQHHSEQLTEIVKRSDNRRKEDRKK